MVGSAKETKKQNKTNIPEISMDEVLSEENSQWFVCLMRFLFHLDGKLWNHGLHVVIYTADFMHFDCCISALNPLRK